MARIANGLTLDKADVVATDVIACLSGVSFTSTIKLVAALNVLKQATGRSYEELLDFEAVPIEMPDSTRMGATAEFVGKVVGSDAARPMARLLRLARFSH